MIDCKHKWPMVITNRGFNTEFCTLYGKSVNDTICSQCEDCEGKTPKEHVPNVHFPRRNEEELQQIKQVCDGCPLLRLKHQTCKKMPGEDHPVDIVAQHPNNHCPEDKW